MSRPRIRIGAAAALFLSASTASGSVVLTANFQTWQTAAGNNTKLDFVFDTAQILSTQYESLGVIFPEGDDYAGQVNAPPPSDGWFLRDSWGNLQTTLLFSSFQTAIGFQAGGGHFFSLYAGDSLVYESPEFGTNPFVGALSTIPFDRMVISRSIGGPSVDTFWFGGTVPAPGTIAVLGAAFVRTRRRRG